MMISVIAAPFIRSVTAGDRQKGGKAMTIPFIMLVDDEVPFVETTAKRLDVRNIETLSAFSGEECLEKLKTHQTIDVIVLDVKMPGMDGLETLKRIKNEAPLVEVIMLTGHATIQAAIDGMKLGAYDFLMKPCDIEELVSKVETAAEKKRDHEKKIEEAKKQETLAKYGPFYYA
jgi:DNA-binding NtrC family response regulator